jgi:hypothetical protein
MRTLRKIAKHPRILAFSAVGAAFWIALAAGCASAQPRMQLALDHLTAARSELEAAEPNKGGHREQAIELVEQAIRQVEMGMNYARNHYVSEYRIPEHNFPGLRSLRMGGAEAVFRQPASSAARRRLRSGQNSR